MQSRMSAWWWENCLTLGITWGNQENKFLVLVRVIIKWIIRGISIWEFWWFPRLVDPLGRMHPCNEAEPLKNKQTNKENNLHELYPRSGDSWHSEALVSLILELGAWGHRLQGRPGCGCAGRGLWPLMPHLLVCVASLLFSHSVILDSLETPWMVARQGPLSMGFPRQEYWSVLPFSPPGDLPDPVI